MKNIFNLCRDAVLNELFCKMNNEKDIQIHNAALKQSSIEVCDDNVVFVANYDGRVWSAERSFNRTQLSAVYAQRIKSPFVYIILESPHVEEFKSNPPIPAAGKTGINTLQSFTLMMNNHCPKDVAAGKYKVAFVNAIQMQTSLGVKPVYFRDHLFRKMWINGARDEFAFRLGSYLKDGDIVINACTCGKTTSKQMKLREDVQMAIDELIKPQDVKYTEIRTEHPSVWGRIINTANKHGTFADYSWKVNSKLFDTYNIERE